MKRAIPSFLSALLFAGCLSPAPESSTCWTVDLSRAARDAGEFQVARGSAESHGIARISSVDVRAPYAGQRIAVLRQDGSVAFDAFNSFAAAPSGLLKGAVYDAVSRSGLFAGVVPSGSSVKASCGIEVVVTELLLDCRESGRRTANVSLLVFVENGRTLSACSGGKGVCEAKDDYSEAFSTAFAVAMRNALKNLRIR